MALFDPKQKSIQSYQNKINDKRDEMERNFKRIGQLYYKQYRDVNIDVTSEINAKCDEVIELQEGIKECEIAILHEKGLKKCKFCDTENKLEYVFCFSCGKKFDEEDFIPDKNIENETEVSDTLQKKEE